MYPLIRVILLDYIYELKLELDRLQRANTGVGRDMDYWSHLAEKLKEGLRVATQRNAEREAKVKDMELGNRNQKQTINHGNTQMAEMEEVIAAQRLTLNSE